ncbi:hypothetical protein O181_114474 [Austropuccinia psidii MF-1]|uniref:Uncharacterized protein n=1 Tax=Austropuccinia psidii MF-1 TaxID=1389203 RepID=A0A9Q3PUN7_9BASI|nr:hypothetical protein [Austropuccinia psidii MF-1]
MVRRPIRPLLAYSNEAKRGQRGKPSSPQGQAGPKLQLDPPEPKLVTNPLDPKLAKDLLDTNLAINPVEPIFGHEPPWTNISAMASGNHQSRSQSDGDLFRTHFHLPISRSQNPTPILKEDYSAHQSDKLWWQSEDSSRIPTTCICRSWVGTLFRIIQRANSQEVLHQ